MMSSNSISQSTAGSQAQIRAQRYLDNVNEQEKGQNSDEALALSEPAKIVSRNIENVSMAPTISLFASGASGVMARSFASLSLERLSFGVSVEEKNALVDYLFEMALSTLGSLEVSNKPSLFLVYAHDNKAYGKAEASTSKYLIEKLSQIQVTLYSDQTPMGQPYSSFSQGVGKGRTLEDILTSQLCLLPDQLRDDVKPVDQVVVCCSEVLGHYLKWPDYKKFYQTLCEAYLEDLEAYRQDNAQSGTLAIRRVVKQFSQEPIYKTGFHHVLTEMAFLQIRMEELEDRHGIIPVVLTPNSYEPCLAHFLPSTPVRIRDIPRFEAQTQVGQKVPPNQGRHIVLFKLIERVLANSNEASLFLNKFWQGYDKFILRLKNESSPLGPLEFAKHINDIFGSISLELHRKIFSTAQQFCNPAWQQVFMQRIIQVQSQEEQEKALQTVSQPLAILGTNIEQFKQAYEKSLRGTGERDVLPMYVPVQGVKKSGQGEETVDLEAELERFFASEATVFLLQGVAGTGKSTFNRHLALKKLEEYRHLSENQNDPPLVFFVELRSIENPNKQVVQQFLQSKGFAPEQIEALRTHPNQRCIFIFDGYDEIKERNRNFYNLNELWEWERSKFVITSRPEYLDANYQTYFRPKGARDGFREAWMAPFSAQQRLAYIQNHVDKTNSLWTVEEYEQALKQLSALGKELERPIVLRMLLQILPGLEKKNQTKKALMLGSVYEHYFQHWWGNWQSRLGVIALTEDEREARKELCERRGGFIRQGFAYIQNCALELTKVGRSAVQDSEDFETRYPGIHEAFFKGGAKTRLLRFNAPFQIKQKQHYEFSHKSMQEYLVARAICAPDFEAKEPHPKDVLNQFSLVKEAVILNFLAEQVEENPHFKAYLDTWIEASKDPCAFAAVGAANAITILVRAGVQFIGADLKGIRIAGADLSGGVLDSAELQVADLSGVNLSKSWLRQANLSGAKMEGVRFGEWPYLWDDSAVISCAYSPDGKACAVGLANGTISVYKTSSWEKIRTLQGHTASVFSVVYSPSGEQIASGSSDNTVRLWDARSGESGRMLQGHTASVFSVVYSSSGEQIASGSFDNTVRLWDVRSGELCRTLQGHTASVLSVVYSSSGEQIASGGINGTVHLWDVRSGELCRTLQGHTGFVSSVVYSPSGEQIASGSSDNTVRLWDARSGELSRTLQGHTGYVWSVAYSPSGEQIASGSFDNTVRLWDARSGELSRTLQGHIGYVSSVAYSPSGEQIASGSSDNTVRLWDARSGELGPTLQGHTSWVRSVVYSPSGEQIASGSSDNTVRLWDARSGESGRTLQGHTASVFSVVYSPSGEQIASGSSDNTVRLWDARSGESGRTLQGHTGSVRSVVYSPSGEQIASGSRDRTVRLWDARSGESGRTLQGHTGSVRSVVYSSSGEQIASGSDDNTVRLWDARSGESCRTLQGHTASVFSVVYSPSGEQIASGSLDRTVRLWDVTSGQCLAVVQGFLGGINSLVWKAISNRTYWVTGCSDKSVRVWQVIEEDGRYQLRLCWSTTNGGLNLADANIQDVQGLSEMNKKLLIQRGALENRGRNAVGEGES